MSKRKLKDSDSEFNSTENAQEEELEVNSSTEKIDSTEVKPVVDQKPKEQVAEVKLPKINIVISN